MKTIFGIFTFTIPLCFGMQQPVKRKKEPQRVSREAPKHQKILTEKEEASRELEKLLQNYDPTSTDLHGKILSLLNKGANPNLRIPGGTPLTMVRPFLIPTLLHKLLCLGADPNVSNTEGITPLMQNASKPDIMKVQILLNHGADPNIKDNAGKTALDHAKIAKLNPENKHFHGELNEIIGLLSKQKIP